MSELIAGKPLVQTAQVKKLEELDDQVFRVLLALDEGVANFLPGQYMEIQVTDAHWQAFSIASLPGSTELQLHIQYLPERENSVALFNKLRSGQPLNISLAGGQCVIQGADRPLTLVAAGTGFAQIKALVESLIDQQWQSPIHLYWAAKTVAGLYDLALAESWQQQLADFTLTPVVEEPTKDWQGKTGLITEAIAADYPEAASATNIEGFICGSPNMVYAVEDLLMSRGMPPRGLLSDAHSYAPRSYD